MRVSSSLSEMMPSMSRSRAPRSSAAGPGRVATPAPRRSSRTPSRRAGRSARSRGVPVGPSARAAADRAGARPRIVAAEGLRADPVISSKSARAASRWVTTIARGIPTAAHSSHTIRVAPSTPSGGRDDEKGRVRRAQTGPEFPDEVGVSGGVQKIDLDAVPFDGHQGQLHRALLAVLDLVVVGDGAAVLDAARPVHRARGQRQRFHQRRLARTEWPTSTTFRTDAGWSAGALPAAPGCAFALSPMALPPVHGEVLGARTAAPRAVRLR